MSVRERNLHFSIEIYSKLYKYPPSDVSSQSKDNCLNGCRFQKTLKIFFAVQFVYMKETKQFGI